MMRNVFMILVMNQVDIFFLGGVDFYHIESPALSTFFVGVNMSLGSFAQALAEEKITKWLLENWPVKLQFGLVCPITWVDGKSLKFNSLTDAGGNPMPFAYPLGQCEDYTDQSFDSWQERVFSFGAPATMYQSCESAIDKYTSSINDVIDVQYAKACRQCMYQGFRLLESGISGNDGEFAGLRSLVPANMTVTVGGVPTLQQFDDAFFKVVDNEGYPNAVMGRTGSLKRFLNLMRAANQDIVYADIEVPDPRTGTRIARVPSIHGVPWYINDAMEVPPEGENVYFMVMGDNGHHTPGHGLQLILPQVRRGDMFVKRHIPITPSNDRGADTGTLASRHAVSVIWPMGIAYGSAGAVSRLANITPL